MYTGEEPRIHTEIEACDAGIRACDAEINPLVYKLYGLTDEEIRIVEESVA